MKMNTTFGICEVCDHDIWEVKYRGPVRDGAYGNYTDKHASVGQCTHCGIARIDEKYCKEENIYETEEYRKLLHEATDNQGFFMEHDVLQLERLNVFPPHNLRGKRVADIGCAAGSFVDHISGLTKEIVCIDPCKAYHDYLLNRGYKVYSYVSEALADQKGQVDIAFCFSVIEHVSGPRGFLAEIRDILNPDGVLVLSTPNRKDILMSLLPDVYSSFFYRSVHRWYFDIDSLAYCSQAAGFNVIDIKSVHRFGLSNCLGWLRDRKPSGRKPIDPIYSAYLDFSWRTFLEEKKMGDYIYATLQVNNSFN